MSQIVDRSLQKVAKGTGVLLLGTVAALLLGLLSRVVVARFFTQSEYGIFSLGLVFLNIFVVVSLLGMGEGAARQIAYYRGKGDTSKLTGVISLSIQIVLVASILLFIALFSLANPLASGVFHDPTLAAPLRIFSVAIPFLALITVFSSIFIGFEQVRPRVYFRDWLRNTLFLLFLLPVILFQFAFTTAIYAFTISTVVTCLVFAIYTFKKSLLTISLKGGRSVLANPVAKELLSLSLPLLGVDILWMVLTWTDTLMLGYFKTSEVVGLYNVALPLAQLVPIVPGSMMFIYIPVVSQLYSQNQLQEMGRTYQVLTKWTFSVTLPLFLILLLFPGITLNFLFGGDYMEADSALRILVLGLMFHVFLGFNGLTLTVMGQTRWLLFGAVIAGATNVVLNAALIPPLGIVGAAMASAASIMALNIFTSTRLYQLSRIHPFTKNYLKPLAISGALLALIYWLTSFMEVELWMLPIILVVFLSGYGLLFLLTRSLDKEDVAMLLALERSTGIDAAPIKRVLRRFVPV